MTRLDETGLSEEPAVKLLEHLGYTYVPAHHLTTERSGPRDVILTGRLEHALKRLNPWLSRDNLRRAIRTVTTVSASTLVEAHETLYTHLMHSTALQQDRGQGKKSHDVFFFDFDDPYTNDLVVTRQFRVRGPKKQIIPDVVIFVNGIPLVVMECKSPTIGDRWKFEGVGQLLRYQGYGDRYRGLGAPRLFHSVQLLIATCGQAAVYGTVGTPERGYHGWRDAWPGTLADLANELGRDPTPQDVLLYGMLKPDNLFDLVRNFMAFDRDESTGRRIKKVARYQQFRAVNRAMTRLRGARQPQERGGVVWHTQGSGKSLTMMWLALKLRCDPEAENPTLVLVSDRRDLDKQITQKFKAAGYPNPERAQDGPHMGRLLSGPGGRTVMTTVQKFREICNLDPEGRPSSQGKPRVLSPATNVFVLTDEAHRSQYGLLAAHLRGALPNAVFLGFTGTPIDKRDRSTLGTFGPYIDQYTIEQAVVDGATVPIFYESRLPELRVVGQSLDRLFDSVFADRSRDERARIKRKYATEKAIAEAPRRIEAICLDLVDHYRKSIEPNGFKAQVVASSRAAAVAYKETLEALHGPPAEVIVSSERGDGASLAAHHKNERQRNEIIERFCDRQDPLKMLVVCDMLLTGFDAPIEQVMYLDSNLREHTLLQAIARVNRPAEGKDYGLVVDYWGVAEHLQEALAIFAPQDVERAMEPKVDELPRLESRHAAAMRFFLRVPDKGDLDACVRVLEPEDVRAEFQLAWRRFAQSMEMLLPDPRALDFAPDLAWLGKVLGAARARYRDRSLALAGCGAKVRRLIDQHIIADGVEVLVKEVNLFSPEFDEKLRALKGDEARASEMEHALRHEIHLRLEEDPVFYRSLRQRLEQIIEDKKARRIDAAQQLRLFTQLRNDANARAQTAEQLDLTSTGLALYGLLLGDGEGQVVAESTIYQVQDPAKKALAEVIEESVAEEVGIVDWVHKEDVQRDMRRRIKRHLIAARYEGDTADGLARAMVDLLRVREGR